MTPHQMANLELLNSLIQSVNGFMCSLEDALPSIMQKERRQKKPNPWKVDLQIGPDIKVGVVGYIKVRRESPKSWKKCNANDGDINEIRPDVTHVRNTEEREVVEREDLIESYKYGSQLIAVSGKLKL